MAYEILKPAEVRPVLGVLFDMDGLVLDTEKLYGRFWREACIKLGYPLTEQQALGLRSLNSKAGETLLQSYFGPELNYSQVRNLRISLMDAWIDAHGVEPKPGIRQLLAFLRDRGIPAALATSSPMERVRRYLGPLQLLDGFQALCSGYEVPQGKPEPDIFLYAAKQLGLSPRDCMVLEDSPAGILAASRAGCLPVMIPDQDQPSAETRALLYGKADSLLDIIDLICK